MSIKRYNVAVVGATGAVGRKMVETLVKRDFPIGQLRLLSSKRSAGTMVPYRENEMIEVEEATPESFEGIDIALFSAGGSVSEVLAPEAVKRGALVIDNTSHFRMDKDVPLVIPEVNPEDIYTNKGIIANPNCSTIQMMVALKPIKDVYGLKRLVVSTYQAVSGTGLNAIEELEKQSHEILSNQEINPTVYPKQIAFNAIPHIDDFLDNGYTKEEMKMINESKKILHDDSIEVNATCVRLPVFHGHSESVYIETNQPLNVNEVKKRLTNSEGIKVIDNPSNLEYPTAAEAEGKDATYVGRIRADLNKDNALSMWIVADNLLKGAALNSVQIAERWIQREK